MARNNRTFLLKRGENGVEMTAILKDAENNAVDLSGWTAQIIVQHRESTTPIVDQAMTVDPDQIANTGKASYTFTSTDSNNTVGRYDLEIVATGPGGQIFKYPKSEGASFGALIILDAK